MKFLYLILFIIAGLFIFNIGVVWVSIPLCIVWGIYFSKFLRKEWAGIRRSVERWIDAHKR